MLTKRTACGVRFRPLRRLSTGKPGGARAYPLFRPRLPFVPSVLPFPSDRPRNLFRSCSEQRGRRPLLNLLIIRCEMPARFRPPQNTRRECGRFLAELSPAGANGDGLLKVIDTGEMPRTVRRPCLPLCPFRLDRRSPCLSCCGQPLGEGGLFA